MFLPPTQKMIRHIKPVFMVSLVNFPTGPVIQPSPPAEETPIVPLPPETPVAEKPVPEKPAASKAATNDMLDEMAREADFVVAGVAL